MCRRVLPTTIRQRLGPTALKRNTDKKHHHSVGNREGVLFVVVQRLARCPGRRSAPRRVGREDRL